jgi:hypothetical protein
MREIHALPAKQSYTPESNVQTLMQQSLSISSRCEYHSSMIRNELAELSAFATAAEERSFTRAAARLGISPSVFMLEPRCRSGYLRQNALVPCGG